jgi:GTP cyclohydrolase IA
MMGENIPETRTYQGVWEPNTVCPVIQGYHMLEDNLESVKRKALESVVRLIQYAGDDPKREGLIDTPNRVLASFDELYSGYGVDPESIMKTFVDGACDEMVICKDIEFYSTCEHHMLPFFGKAHIAYIPNGKVIGLSKLARLLEIFSRRLQIQERIGQQVTEALMKHLEPRGAACVIEAKHFCMCARGVQKQSSVMTTSSLAGAFRDDDKTRAEFLHLIK